MHSQVWDRPNPPRYGKHSVNNNRPEGYADYRPDRYYMGPDPAFVIVRALGKVPQALGKATNSKPTHTD